MQLCRRVLESRSGPVRATAAGGLPIGSTDRPTEHPLGQRDTLALSRVRVSPGGGRRARSRREGALNLGFGGLTEARLDCGGRRPPAEAHHRVDIDAPLEQTVGRPAPPEVVARYVAPPSAVPIASERRRRPAHPPADQSVAWACSHIPTPLSRTATYAARSASVRSERSSLVPLPNSQRPRWRVTTPSPRRRSRPRRASRRERGGGCARRSPRRTVPRQERTASRRLPSVATGFRLRVEGGHIAPGGAPLRNADPRVVLRAPMSGAVATEDLDEPRRDERATVGTPVGDRIEGEQTRQPATPDLEFLRRPGE